MVQIGFVSELNSANKLFKHEKSPIDKRPTLQRYTSHSMRPLNQVMSLIGVNKFSYCKNDIRVLSSAQKSYILLVAILISILPVYLVFNAFQMTVPSIIVMLDIMLIVFSALTCLSAIFNSGFADSEKMITVVKNLDLVDRKLNSGINHERAKIKIIIAIVATMLFNVFNNWFQMHTNDFPSWTTYVLLENLIATMVTFHLLDFSVVLWMNIVRVRNVNDRLKAVTEKYDQRVVEVSVENFYNDFKCINVIKEDGAPELKDFSLSVHRSESILFVLKLFDALADNIQIINYCYGLTLLLSSTTAFLSVLCTVNGLIREEEMSTTIGVFYKIKILLWSAPVALFLLMAAYVSEMLKEEIERTSTYVDKLTISPSTDPDQLQLLECFSQLLAGRNMFISAYDFFSFDFSFVFSLIGTIATYTVILMQVKDTSSSIHPNSKPSTVDPKND